MIAPECFSTLVPRLLLDVGRTCFPKQPATDSEARHAMNLEGSPNQTERSRTSFTAGTDASVHKLEQARANHCHTNLGCYYRGA